MKFILWLDGKGWAIYDPNDGQIEHTLIIMEAVEATMADWSDLLGPELVKYKPIPRLAEIGMMLHEKGEV
jgi:hypothetical protein